jgi:recombination protein RecA
MADKEKLKKLKEACNTINKVTGENTVMLLSEVTTPNIDVIPTGSLGLDIALGVNGLPRGRVVEIYGPESSGKTTLATHIIAEAQKKGGICAFIDAEHAFDADYAANLEVDIETLVIHQPDYGEQALEVAEKLISSGTIDVCVIDSVAALTPKKEIDGEMDDSSMGLHARLMSKALRKLTATTRKNNVLLIFINQLRDKIGVMFGSPETTTGGNALKFYASVRLDVRRSLTAENSVMDGKEKVGNLTTIKVVKNKVAPPFKKAEVNIIYGKGFDKVGELVLLASDRLPTEVFKKWGKQITYKDQKYDIVEFTELLSANEEFKNEIENLIKNTKNDKNS